MKVAKTPEQAARMAIKKRYHRNLRLKKTFPTYRPMSFREDVKIPLHQVNKMRMMYESGHAGMNILARMFGVSKFMVFSIVKYHSHILDDREKSLIEMQNCGEISISSS